MKSVTSTVTTYVADDGTSFFTEKECLAHEAKVREEEKNTSYWRVVASPDLTEGRGYSELRILKVQADIYGPVQSLVEDWCFRTYGRPVAFVMGVAPITSWFVKQADKAAWFDAGKERPNDYVSIGDYKTRARQLQLVMGEGERGLALIVN